MLLIYASFSHFNLLLATKINAFIKSPDFCNRACITHIIMELFKTQKLQSLQSYANPQFHPKAQMNEHGKSSERHIPTFISPPRENISHRPAGFVRRQYNCHECDYQGHRSKALFNHSIVSGHKKIDSLEETCFTCLQTFDNFIDLMKHRKVSHYDIISECHKFKAGGCQFKERCYYKHTATQNPPDKGQDDSFP